MNRYSKLAYNSLITAFMSLVLLSPALAGIQCYSQDSYSSNFISAVQKELKAQGFYQGTVDGRWGQKTTEALEGFKSARDLTGTLRVDAGTLRALFGPEADAESYGLTPNPDLPQNIFATHCR
jgi:peptidoglycan hydrolase-like protein with peptidoglycan-binding domain